jgi:hypothetical protein
MVHRWYTSVFMRIFTCVLNALQHLHNLWSASGVDLERSKGVDHSIQIKPEEAMFPSRQVRPLP